MPYGCCFHCHSDVPRCPCSLLNAALLILMTLAVMVLCLYLMVRVVKFWLIEMKKPDPPSRNVPGWAQPILSCCMRAHAKFRQRFPAKNQPNRQESEGDERVASVYDSALRGEGQGSSSPSSPISPLSPPSSPSVTRGSAVSTSPLVNRRPTGSRHSKKVSMTKNPLVHSDEVPLDEFKSVAMAPGGP